MDTEVKQAPSTRETNSSIEIQDFASPEVRSPVGGVQDLQLGEDSDILAELSQDPDPKEEKLEATNQKTVADVLQLSGVLAEQGINPELLGYKGGHSYYIDPISGTTSALTKLPPDLEFIDHPSIEGLRTIKPSSLFPIELSEQERLTSQFAGLLGFEAQLDTSGRILLTLGDGSVREISGELLDHS